MHFRIRGLPAEPFAPLFALHRGPPHDTKRRIDLLVERTGLGARGRPYAAAFARIAQTVEAAEARGDTLVLQRRT